MTQESYRHPIAPPTELVQQWYNQADKLNEPFITYIAARAAQWGWDQREPEIQAVADQELPMQFRGVPLIPPLDCTDPQSWIAERIYQMGADQELEACCDHIHTLHGKHRADWLRDMRRPKPPSLKEQALETLKYPKDLWSEIEVDTIRRALEALPDD